MSTEGPQTCSYVRTDGSTCSRPVEGEEGLCYWHDHHLSKETPGVREELVKLKKEGESLEGFVLRYADLEGIRLDSAEGVNLSHSVLFRARLKGASMWNINLQGADIKKADLTGANLNEANLVNAGLLGASLEGTKLERVVWGEQAVQEQMARKAEAEGEHEKALVNFEEAEEVYRGLRRAYDSTGRFDEAGQFFQKEMTMRRKMMPKWSSGRIWSKLVDLFCGYGEVPQRVIGFSLLLVFVCAAGYFGAGVNGPEGRIGFDAEGNMGTNIRHFLNCVYYSIVTFTTLGYGDITPRGLARPIAAFEAFAGAFMMALFVAVFGKKMTR